MVGETSKGPGPEVWLQQTWSIRFHQILNSGQVSVETRYYISSLESDAQWFLQAIRSHWGIENRVHWVLDVSFREDESRVRTGNAPENLAIVRHMALTGVGIFVPCL